MTTDKMTLAEMLRNPQRTKNGQLAAFNETPMKAAADLLEIKLPCEVWIEPGLMIAKGEPLESLLIAIQGRL